MDPSTEHCRCSAGDQYHRVSAMSIDGSVVVSFQVGVNRVTSSCSFLAVVVEEGQSPIVIAETEIAAPLDSWELRGQGLWADHICEHPFEHWSYGLEAFALQLDDPEELLGRGYGDRVPLGWELEFESDVEPVVAADGEYVFDYSQDGLCHGIVLFKGRELAFEGPALRQHWVATTTSGNGTLQAGTSNSKQLEARVALPTVRSVWWFDVRSGFVSWERQDR